jgi:hypothetical protein
VCDDAPECELSLILRGGIAHRGRDRCLTNRSSIHKRSTLQSSFFKFVHQLTNDVSKTINVMKSAEDIGLMVDKTQLLKLRVHLKRCIGVHSVLQALSAKALPKESAELVSYVQDLLSKLKKKGIGPGKVELPIMFAKALDAMVKPRSSN